MISPRKLLDKFLKAGSCIKELIRGSRERIEDLENLISAEFGDAGRDKDLGWDITLKEEFGEIKTNKNL